MQVATGPLFVTDQVLSSTKNQRYPRMAERPSALPSLCKGPKTHWSSNSSHGKQKIAKEIYSQLSAKPASNMRRKQFSCVYVRDPFDFDQSESDEQFKSEDCLGKSTRKRQVRKNKFLVFHQVHVHDICPQHFNFVNSMF